ncbi:Nucleoside diphosphate-linked moiety X motif 6 [Hondaea fermentalgiana]|uniref:Nucleoside diphosphate-linked moiety X motif 6 n=1 Tax=Hondaea fermentalgiana TaxID=2315210 RepID=A0A2R5GQ64_9STRA|nr:Nucleoside diphosphate-linked moiety X motif 6 [Hondaea fermentalgiana]|eukprot:GBG30763.1 Nucleoside diphosphate-linked moiety X motif 6 [Hondaea fermentalgiana]
MDLDHKVAVFAAGVIAGAAATMLYVSQTQASCDNAKSKSKPVKVGVGIGVALQSADGKSVLVGLRKGSHGSGQWALPGGWLERGEAFEECALRELAEETGVEKRHLDSGYPVEVANIRSCNNAEFGSVSVFVTCRLAAGNEGVVRICEPDKCVEWRWIKNLADLGPEATLFRPLRYYFDNK